MHYACSMLMPAPCNQPCLIGYYANSELEKTYGATLVLANTTQGQLGGGVWVGSVCHRACLQRNAKDRLHMKGTSQAALLAARCWQP